MKRMSFQFRLMIMTKRMFLVLCLCAAGCGGAQAQGWAVVERDSVSVAVDGGSWSGGWSPALQGTVLGLRAAEAGSGGVPVWYHGIPARVPAAAVSVFRWSAVPLEALCRTYDLKACYGGKESVARVDFVPFDSLLLMRLPRSKQGVRQTIMNWAWTPRACGPAANGRARCLRGRKPCGISCPR